MKYLKLLVYLVVIGGLFSSVGCGSSYRKTVRKGDNCVSKRDFSCALKQYTKAIEIRSEVAEPYLRRSAVYAVLGQDTQAKKDIEVAKRLDPTAQDWFELAYFYDQTHEIPNKAIWAYSQAIRENPEFARAYYRRGRLFLDEGELEKAIRDFQESLKHRPNQWRSHASLGLAYQRKGEFKKSIEKFTVAIENHSNDTDVVTWYRNRARSYLQLGDTISARKDVKVALERNVDTGLILHLRGMISWVEGDLGSAEKDLIRARRLLTDSDLVPLIEANICGLYVDKSKISEALDYCRKALSSPKKPSYAYYQRARAYMEKGDYENALSDIKKAKDNMSNLPRFGYVRPLWEQRPKEAIRNLESKILQKVETEPANKV